MKLLAHVRQMESGEWDVHELREHLEGVGELAARNADPMKLDKTALISGLVHDFGKASEAFQNKIKGQSGYDPEVHVNSNVDHATAGAQYLVKKYGKDIGSVLGYTIVGHHGGLPNGIDETNSDLRHRLSKEIEPYIENLPLIELPENLILSDFIPRKNSDGKPQFPFLIRMIYSCLVDADFLDTERFMSPVKSEERSTKKSTIPELQKKLNNYISRFKPVSPINEKRADILEWCRGAAEQRTGIFSLTVPTGGGKTVSSVAFALDHAIKNNLRRIIYVIPYTSIITQNAEVFREIFGEDNVLEHHSNLDPEKETALNRLSSQNWDAPIVVTTNVQFFESFYSNRSSACRKLHNVVDSVIIFDEAQMFPAEYLKPSLAVIRELTASYGCTAVLCTATQPTLSDTNLLKKAALQNVHEIVPDPKSLYNDFKRVDVTLLDDPLTHKDIAERMAEQNQVLTIVNTRKEAREIMESLEGMTDGSDACYHLSTMMCPEHRSEILKTIRKRIDENLPCKVTSTQLIEAGVDVDFPVVYRAMAGMDSIAQAAGRCNRNGKYKRGKVYVFKGETQPPVGYLRQAAESGERVLEKHKNDPLASESVADYFQDFYWKQNNAHKMDKKEIMPLLRPPRPDQMSFKDIAVSFKIIEEQTEAIIIPYKEAGEALINQLRDWADELKYKRSDKQFLPREMQKKAQRFSVQLWQKPFEELLKARVLEDLFGDGQYWILINKDIYKKSVGLCPDTPKFIKTESLVM